MDGSSRQLIGLGHDFQSVDELRNAVALRTPGVFFTSAEIRRFASAVNPSESMAAGFAAKEALFKALPAARIPWFWTDAELVHDRHGAPLFRAHGSLADHLARRRMRVNVSLSHSGGYVSSVVLVTGGRAAGHGLHSTLTRTGRTVLRVLRRIATRSAGAAR
ncbi:4'-phosphopantetheinyl transferase superfamily protein [Streptomyces sp. NPDC006923]|uniref:holo-ACP synthase n=1 Tax=Streptomyces sp. NPDC006923 TaxID=3155355 RepID=UPI0033CE4498